MKIVYCVDSINYVGGIQRVTVSKANALSELPGNEVWIIVADNSGSSCYYLSPSVHLVDLAVNYFEDDWKSELHALKGYLFKRPKHKKALTRVLKEVMPDIVVSVGTSEKYLILRIKGDWAVVREFHSPKNYRHLFSTSYYRRIVAYIGDILDFNFTIRRYDRIVVLTKADLELNWAGFDRVIAIPNPIVSSFQPSSLDRKCVIAVGRLVPSKGFSSLIRSFRTVVNRFPDWQLDIWGEGAERQNLEEEIDKNGLTGSVRLRGVSNNVQQEMLSDSLFVFTSQYEGFGITFLEAMSCGLPVVSYDCDFGPGEIIEDGKDGFLVPVGDEDTLAERICSLIEDEGLRKRVGVAALEKSKKYSIENIIRMWMELFEDLCHEKGTKRR